MYKASTALFLYAETSVHAGSGESLGAIDLAIQRERHTDFPCVAAQGVKGSVRDWFERVYKMPEKPVIKDLDEGQKLVISAFGPETSNASDHAGAVAFTDARLLLFPVRSMKGIFAWITCPFALGRLQRDLSMVIGNGASLTKGLELPKPDQDSAWGGWDKHGCLISTSASGANGNQVLLEEELFQYKKDESVQKWAEFLRIYAFSSSTEYDFWKKRVSPLQDEEELSHLLVLHDNDFRHFVKTAVEVQARIKLGPKKTTTDDGSLFYQENLPSDAVLYSMVLAADDLSGHPTAGSATADKLLAFIRTGANVPTSRPGLDANRLQIGGDETTGKGYVFANFLKDRAIKVNQI